MDERTPDERLIEIVQRISNPLAVNALKRLHAVVKASSENVLATGEDEALAFIAEYIDDLEEWASKGFDDVVPEIMDVIHELIGDDNPDNWPEVWGWHAGGQDLLDGKYYE